MYFYPRILLLWLSLGLLSVQAEVTLEECQDLSPKDLRQSLMTVVQTSIQDQALAPDEAQLQRLWYELQIDNIVAAETDKAVNRIRENSSYFERYGSTWGTESTEKFTKDIINQVFNSPAFNERIELLIKRYSEATQTQLAPVLAKGWAQGNACLGAFIGERYSGAIAHRFNQAGQQVNQRAAQGLQQMQVGGITSHKQAMAGVAVLVGKKVLQKMVQNLVARVSAGVGQRIGGAIASKVIPGIGWGLLVWDLFASADGILPEVASVLKSSDTKNELLAQLKQGIQDELLAADKIATQIADNVLTQWQGFRQRHQQILDLAEQNLDFKRKLATLVPEQIDRFSTLIGILLSTVGTEQTLLQSGKVIQLMELPKGLASSVDEILTDTRSIETTLKWYQQVGESERKFTTLAHLDIHRHKQPDDLKEGYLDKLLVIDDKQAVSSLLTLDAIAFAQALSLATEDLRNLALRTNLAGWQTFAWYRQQLGGDLPAQAHFTQVVIKQPHTLSVFEPQATRLIVMNAKDKMITIDEVAGLSGGWFGGFLGGLLTLLQWVVVIAVLWLLVKFWPIIRLVLQPFWLLLRSKFPLLHSRLRSMITRNTPSSEKTVN